MTASAGAGFAGVLRQREFGLLWLVDAQSLLGDQLARVALAVLVYTRTGSGLATAAVYSLTLLPAFVGSLLFAALPDRLPRRALLVAGDLIRAVLLAVMALPGMPVAGLAALLVVVVLVGAPWKAAEQALIVDLLSAEDYVTGVGLRTASTQAAQLAGFAVGGVVVAVVGARSALAIDAATFAVSALVIRLAIRPRPAAQRVAAARGWFHGMVVTLRDRRLRLLMALSWLLGVLVIPEGVAAPYAHQLGGGSTTLGLLFAALPAGVLVGSVVYTRLVDARARAALLGPLAAVAGLPLVGCAWQPGTTGTILLWALAGACTAYQVQVAAEFAALIPDHIRGQGMNGAAGGLLAAQGIGILAGGALVTVFAPSTTVAIAGAAATALGLFLAAQRRRYAPGMA